MINERGSTTDPVQESPRLRLAFLDSIRALAALWVVLSHIWISQFGMFSHPGVLGLLTNWAVYSHLAVDVFIVLSGFCLILPVVRDGGLICGPVAFFGRRAWRILPPYYAALLFSLLIALLLQARNHALTVLSTHAFVVNACLMQDVFLNQDIFNGPFWSIAVEWRIYFLFPVLAWTLMRGGALASLAWTALLGFALTYAVFQWQPGAIMACPWYLLLFAMGASAGTVALEPADSTWRRRKAYSCCLGAFAVCLAVLLYSFPITPQSGTNFGKHMPLIDTCAGACTALFLILITRNQAASRSTIAKVLNSRPLTMLGSFAYSLYLIHMPCVLLLSRLIAGWPFLPIIRVILLTIVGFPVIIGLAYLFFLCFERPFLQSSRIAIRPQQLKTLLGVWKKATVPV